MNTSMSREEIDAFLDGERTLVLTALRRDGSPISYALWFVRVGAALYVNTRRDSLKARLMTRDPRVCGLVESGEHYFELRGVRVEGRAAPVEDPDERERVGRAMAEKDRRLGSGTRDLPGWFARSREDRLRRGDRVLFRIPMERVYSWDFGRLREHYRSSEGERSGPGREGGPRPEDPAPPPPSATPDRKP